MNRNERFWNKVDKTSTCWLWTGNVLNSGYGQFALTHSKMIQAHRYAYLVSIGPIPHDLFVLHMCDVKNCVNPAHLFLGTNSDNQIDCRNKGGLGHQTLTKADIPGIRKLLRLGHKQKEIAARYGVGYRAISQIKNGWRWAGV